MEPENRIWYNKARSLKFFFHGQLWHAFSLLILLPVTWSFAAPVMTDGYWPGIKDITWFWLAVFIPVIHQVMVWIVFRLQMGWGTLSGRIIIAPKNPIWKLFSMGKIDYL